jgi:RNA ligase
MSPAPLKLNQMLDSALLDAMVAERFVKVTAATRTGLRIFNYTARAQYEECWNPVTMACRGLIVNELDEVVARPFAKFFNYDKGLVAGLDAAVQVTEKMDGSLGILYRAGEELRIATRGSFASEQALHATGVLQERHAGFVPVEGWTYLFEIVYPQNRIVVDYGDRDELVLLGAVEIESGRSVALEDAASNWNGPVVDVLPYGTLEEALEAPVRSGAEGVVVHFLRDDVRVKIKQEEYVRMHRLVTEVSERRVWEVLAAGGTLDQWLEGVPDELYMFVRDTQQKLTAGHQAVSAGLHAELDGIISSLGDDWTRRELAEKVRASSHPLARALFALADGKDISGIVWEHLRPAEHVPFFQQR